MTEIGSAASIINIGGGPPPLPPPPIWNPDHLGSGPKNPSKPERQNPMDRFFSTVDMFDLLLFRRLNRSRKLQRDSLVPQNNRRAHKVQRADPAVPIRLDILHNKGGQAESFPILHVKIV